jgi:hypothetical protein
MKILPALMVGLIVGTVSVPNAAFAQSYGRFGQQYERNDNWWGRWSNARDDRRGLEGTWYLVGERDRAAQIVQTRQGLHAINEYGEASRLTVSSNGDVRALDWDGGLHGDVRRDRIDWANGTTWIRRAGYSYR